MSHRNRSRIAEEPPLLPAAATASARRVGARLRATIAAYRCAKSIEQEKYDAAREDFAALQGALQELTDQAGGAPQDEFFAALQERLDDLGYVLALRAPTRRSVRD